MDLQLRSLSDGLNVAFDLLQTTGGLVSEEEALATAVIIALGTDRRANLDDELPGIDDDQDLRGWWGDSAAEIVWNGWPVGSRLWLLERAKITGTAARIGALVARVEEYVNEALQPFIQKGIASRVSVEARRADITSIECNVVIYRGPKPAIALQFQSLWDGVRK